MELIRVLIVEDELIIAAHIQHVLENAGFNVLEILTKGEQVISFMHKNQVDIVLMDINLAGELDGVETAEIINKTSKTPIIYLTSNNDDHNYERAKSTFPYAFLAKPFKEKDLIRSFELISQRFFQEDDSTFNKQENTVLSESIFIRDIDKSLKIKIDDILFLEAERNYCKIYTKNNSYLLSVPMKSVESKISSKNFVRVHRSYIANLINIDSFSQSFLFFDKHKVPISKSNRQNVLSLLTVIK